MIKTFSSEETGKIFHRQFSRVFPPEIQRNALIKLRMWNRIFSPSDLKALPGNKFSLMRNERKGKFSVSVGEKWSLCFSVSNGDFYGLELITKEKINGNYEQMKFTPLHPGEILEKEFLRPLSLSQNKLANLIGVPPRRINEIVLRKRKITAGTAILLGKYFKISPEFWLGLQSDYELDVEFTKRNSVTG